MITHANYMLLLILNNVRNFACNAFGVNIFESEVSFTDSFKVVDGFEFETMFVALTSWWGCLSTYVLSNCLSLKKVLLETLKEKNAVDGKCLVMKAGNYLGFEDICKDLCDEEVKRTIRDWPISLSTSSANLGVIKVQARLEKTIATYLKKDAALVHMSNHADNAVTLCPLLGPECLLIADIESGDLCRLQEESSGVVIREFDASDTNEFEFIIGEAIINGQPSHHRPWKKIIVFVEGLNLDKGAVCKLKEIVAIAKKYKAYVVVNEAHSIGAIGATGRGVCEYTGVDPSDVDILMGTFTKSFGGMGGYIAGSKEMIDYLKSSTAGMMVHNAMSPVVCQQVLTALRVIIGEDGTTMGREITSALVENCRYFHNAMVGLGLHVYSDVDSPVVVIGVYCPHTESFARECLKRGLTVQELPATSVILSRVRFCLSASLTREDLDFAIRVIDELSSLLMMKYSSLTCGRVDL